MGACSSKDSTVHHGGMGTTSTKHKLQRGISTTTASTAATPGSYGSGNNSNSTKNLLLLSQNIQTSNHHERTSLLYEGLVREHVDTTDDQNHHADHILEKYEILKVIGTGSFSNVYQIRKVHFNLHNSGHNSTNNSRHGNKDDVVSDNVEVDLPTATNASAVATTATTSSSSPMSPNKKTPCRQSVVQRIQRWNSNHDDVALPSNLYFCLKEIDISLTVGDTTDTCHVLSKEEQEKKQKKIDMLLNEVHILKTLDHPNIIKIYETYTTSTSVQVTCPSIHDPASLPTKPPSKVLQVIMEYCPGGDLYNRVPYYTIIKDTSSSMLSTNEQQVLQLQRTQQEHIIAMIVRQIVLAVSYIHDAPHYIIHRDIKFENIIYETTDPNSYIKLIDFGVSSYFNTIENCNGYTERIGTLYSMAPETMKAEHYTTQADLWSIGVVTYMLFTNGTQPFDAPTNKEIIQNVLKCNYDTNILQQNNISKEAYDFITSLLVVDPNQRLTAQTAKLHPWLTYHHQLDLDKAKGIIADNNLNNNTSFFTSSSSSKNKSKYNHEEMKRQVREVMIHYANASNFIKLALNVLAKQHKLSPKRMKQLSSSLSTNNNRSKQLSSSTTQSTSSYENDTVFLTNVRILFDTLDVDQSGTLSFNEFKELFTTTPESATSKQQPSDKANYTDEFVEKLFYQLDVNQNHVITYTEFLAAVLEMHGKIDEYRFAEAFDQLDCDDSGYISKENIRQILGDQVDDEYIDQIIADADYLNDGQISYGEFQQALHDQMTSLVRSIRSGSIDSTDEDYSHIEEEE